MSVDKAERQDVGVERLTDSDIQVLEALRDLFGNPDANAVANEALDAIGQLQKQTFLHSKEQELLFLLVGAFVGALIAGTVKGIFDQLIEQLTSRSSSERFDMVLRGLHEYQRR